MFIAMNHFNVNPDRGQDFEEVWKGRESYLKDLDGFVQFSLLKGDDPGDYISHTIWESRQDFLNWAQSEHFRRAPRAVRPRQGRARRPSPRPSSTRPSSSSRERTPLSAEPLEDNPLLPEHFRRVDESDDSLFYVQPRLVNHIDDAAIAALGDFYRETFPAGGHVLDLMSSWVSHLPADRDLRGA